MRRPAARLDAPERRLLPDGRAEGPMPWVLAIMLFLLILAAAGGLAMARAAAGLGEGIADRVTVQVVEADPAARDEGVRRALRLLAADPAARSAARVPDAEVAALIEPWLGEGALAARAALNGHRGTIETLRLLGATDRQIVRLFGRRIALDAGFGGAVALAAAAAVLLLLGARLAELQSSLVSLAALGPSSWALLAALPAAGVLLATLVARATLLRALRRSP